MDLARRKRLRAVSTLLPFYAVWIHMRLKQKKNEKQEEMKEDEDNSKKQSKTIWEGQGEEKVTERAKKETKGREAGGNEKG